MLHRHSVRLVLARPLEWNPFQSDLLVLCFARGIGGTLLVGGAISVVFLHYGLPLAELLLSRAGLGGVQDGGGDA